MHFAFVNDIQVEAKTGLTGICLGCGYPVIAKCGNVKGHYWAHKRSEMCDDWRET